jgi:hypothetical protein
LFQASKVRVAADKVSALVDAVLLKIASVLHREPRRFLPVICDEAQELIRPEDADLFRVLDSAKKPPSAASASRSDSPPPPFRLEYVRRCFLLG